MLPRVPLLPPSLRTPGVPLRVASIVTPRLIMDYRFCLAVISMLSDHSALRFGGRLILSLIHFVESYLAPITLAHSYSLSTSRNHHQVITSHHANYRSPSPPSVFDIFPMYQHTAIINSSYVRFRYRPHLSTRQSLLHQYRNPWNTICRSTRIFSHVDDRQSLPFSMQMRIIHNPYNH
jgi:hypothetical protein